MYGDISLSRLDMILPKMYAGLFCKCCKSTWGKTIVDIRPARQGWSLLYMSAKNGIFSGLTSDCTASCSQIVNNWNKSSMSRSTEQTSTPNSVALSDRANKKMWTRLLAQLKNSNGDVLNHLFRYGSTASPILLHKHRNEVFFCLLWSCLPPLAFVTSSSH